MEVLFLSLVLGARQLGPVKVDEGEIREGLILEFRGPRRLTLTRFNADRTEATFSETIDGALFEWYYPMEEVRQFIREGRATGGNVLLSGRARRPALTERCPDNARPGTVVATRRDFGIPVATVKARPQKQAAGMRFSERRTGVPVRRVPGQAGSTPADSTKRPGDRREGIVTNPTLKSRPCPYCGCFHTGVCSRVKAIEYHPDGTVKRVEFHGPIPPPTLPPQQEPSR